MENVITLGKLLSLWFYFLLLSILFLKTQTSCRTYKIISSNELARPVMGTIFLVELQCSYSLASIVILYATIVAVVQMEHICSAVLPTALHHPSTESKSYALYIKEVKFDFVWNGFLQDTVGPQLFFDNLKVATCIAGNVYMLHIPYV